MMLMAYDNHQTDFNANGDPINGAYAAHVTREEGFYLKFKLALDEEGNYKKNYETQSIIDSQFE